VKKIILALVTVAFVGFGSTPALAQDDPAPSVPIECAEDELPDPAGGCEQFYPPTTPTSEKVAPPSTGAVSPPTPPPSVNPPPPNDLPRTGSGISSTLGVGALLLLAGSLIVVAARRRTTATNPAG
jgi:LPXTG-motif cell wall-anchored protein